MMMKINFGSNLCRFVCVLTVGIIAGCANQSDKIIACENQVTKLKQENEKLTRQLVDCQQQIISQKNQIENLQHISPDRLKDMIKLERITLDRLTGGYDDNHDGYADGIVVYLQPIDTDGHIVKTPGSVKVQLFLLGDKPVLIGQRELSPNELRKKWTGRLWTNHYTIRCPFKITPKSPEVTVRTEFVELLTGKPFVAQKRVKIKVHPK